MVFLVSPFSMYRYDASYAKEEIGRGDLRLLENCRGRHEIKINQPGFRRWRRGVQR